MHSPTPGYSAYSQTQVQHGCNQFAALHNVTKPEQRSNAVRVLKGYEDDLRALGMKQQSRRLAMLLDDLIVK